MQFSSFYILASCWLWSLFLASGCSKAPAPPTGLQPVGGIVLGADGKPYSRGGMIEFRMATDRKIRATSAIDQAGRFTLQFADTNARFKGALPGNYEVTIYPLGAQVVEPLKLANLVTINPQETSLEISLADVSQ